MEKIPNAFPVPAALFYADFISEASADNDMPQLHIYKYEDSNDANARATLFLENGLILPEHESQAIQFVRTDWRGGYYIHNGENCINPPNVTFTKISNDNGKIKWSVAAGRMGGDIWDVITEDNEITSIIKSEWDWII